MSNTLSHKFRRVSDEGRGGRGLEFNKKIPAINQYFSKKTL